MAEKEPARIPKGMLIGAAKDCLAKSLAFWMQDGKPARIHVLEGVEPQTAALAAIALLLLVVVQEDEAT